jgi:hypothetical protein
MRRGVRTLLGKPRLDPDLELLRGRPDFQKLLAELLAD